MPHNRLRHDSQARTASMEPLHVQAETHYVTRTAIMCSCQEFKLLQISAVSSASNELQNHSVTDVPTVIWIQNLSDNNYCWNLLIDLSLNTYC
jgi:hypothetical protein